MYFIGVNGARIYVKHICPKKITGKIPAVLAFHGYLGNSGDWSYCLRFVLAGLAVFAMDIRGQGRKSEDVGGVNLYFLSDFIFCTNLTSRYINIYRHLC